MMKPNITPVGTFQRITNTAPLRAETREAIQNTVLQFYVQNSQPEDDAEGLTACYERLSQEDKLDGESNSIINQKKILEKYCRDHGYTAIRHYDEDDGYSGTNFNRPGFQRMLADIKAGKIKRVVVKDMSRLGRNYLQVGMYTEMVFPEYGVHFNPSEWVIFENTQEAIIEESVFLVVQNIRQARRRPTKMGDMGMFSGLVYCADCGGKMYLCRANHFKPEQEYYICSTYRKDRTLCKTHSIRRVVLEEIVLRNLREAIAYVTQYEDDFIQRAAERSQQERDKALAQKKAVLAQSEKRIAELDVIFKRIYEDNISGKLSDERFIKLSRDYEQEQAQLKTIVETLGREVKQQEQKKTNVRKFISVVKKYTDMTQLDATILREFVEQIRVSDTYTTDEQQKRVKIREIEIVYNFIGAFDFEGAREQSQTAQDKNIAKVGAA